MIGRSPGHPRPLRGALGLLTVVGPGGPPSSAALTWFPPVGAALGAVVGLVWWGAGNAWAPYLAAVLAVGADLGLTGLLHLDGLADSADGLLPHLSPERRLAVMAAPDVGAFGVGVVALTLAARVGGVLGLPEGAQAVALCAGIWAGSRALMAVTLRAIPYARPGGLADAFSGGSALGALLTGIPLAVGLVLVGRGLVGLAALAAGVLAGIALVGLAHRRLGGFTGDVLGAAGVVTETVALVVAAARW